MRASRTCGREPMALINCPECGARVSDRAPACPKCGCPISEPPRERRSHEPAPVHITSVQFTRKWVKALSFLAGVPFFGGLALVMMAESQTLVAGMTKETQWGAGALLFIA